MIFRLYSHISKQITIFILIVPIGTTPDSLNVAVQKVKTRIVSILKFKLTRKTFLLLYNISIQHRNKNLCRTQVTLTIHIWSINALQRPVMKEQFMFRQELELFMLKIQNRHRCLKMAS